MYCCHSFLVFFFFSELSCHVLLLPLKSYGCVVEEGNSDVFPMKSFINVLCLYSPTLCIPSWLSSSIHSTALNSIELNSITVTSFKLGHIGQACAALN